MNFAYYNGAFGDFSDIKIPITDRAVFFGDGVYEACIGRDGEIFLLSEHIERLLSNAMAVGIPIQKGPGELVELLKLCIKRSGLSEYFIYIQLTGFLEKRLHAPRDKSRSNLLITVTPYKPDAKEDEIDLISYKDIRQGFCNIKTINLLGSLFASEAGASEAVFIRDGFVTEGARSNVSIIKNGTLLTHPKNEFILPGITRNLLLKCAKERGIPYEEKAFTFPDLISADDVIITSTSKLAKRAKSIDKIALPRKNSDECIVLIDEMFKCYRNFC